MSANPCSIDYLMDPAFGASAKWLQQVRAAFPPFERESGSESGLETVPEEDVRCVIRTPSLAHSYKPNTHLT
jgi:hypothetical protein